MESFVNPIRRKIVSFLTEAAYRKLGTIDAGTQCAKELSNIDDVEGVVRQEVVKICAAATLTEMTRVLFLARRLKKASGQEKVLIRTNLNTVAEELLTRVETRSCPLRLPRTCRYLLLNL